MSFFPSSLSAFTNTLSPLQNLMSCLAVGLGGFLGSLLRYAMTFIPLKSKSGFPWITLITNVLGCLFIAWICSRIDGQSHPRLMLFLKVGLCGGFTTFSTLALESQQLLRQGRLDLALAYIASTLILGIACIFLVEALHAL